jgi:hypothetical protein
VISHLWERPRPFTAHPALTHLLSAPSVDPSFPSDHAAVAIAVAIAVLASSRRAGLLFLATGTLIALSREPDQALVGDGDRTGVLARAERRERGRNALNFSEWDKPRAALDNVIESVQSGSMPPLQYKLFHGNARLSDAERRQLVDGLRQLYATDPPAGTKQGGG